MTTLTAVRVPNDLRAELLQLARERGLTLSDVIRQSMAEAIEKARCGTS